MSTAAWDVRALNCDVKLLQGRIKRAYGRIQKYDGNLPGPSYSQTYFYGTGCLCSNLCTISSMNKKLRPMNEVASSRLSFGSSTSVWVMFPRVGPPQCVSTPVTSLLFR